MAPTAPTAPKTKPVPSGQKRREALQKRLLVEEQKQNANNQQEIERLRAAINKKDEELAALTTQEMKELDVEMPDYPDDDAKNIKSKSQKAKERKRKKQNAAKIQQEALLPSIEEPDRGENPQDKEGLFKSDSESESDDDGSEAESDGHESDSSADFDPDPDSAAFSDEDYGKALFTFPGTKPVKGVKTVGWSGGRFTGYINMYGKKSVARYRVQRSAFPAQYEDDQPKKEKVSNPANRHGDEMKANGKFKYTKRHIRGIMAVAWKPLGLGVSRDDVDDINPDNVEKGKWGRVPTYVLIAWDIDGDGRNIKKTWETRACLRTRWGKKDADIAIYEAAVEAEDRYEEAMTGKRPARSKSPSVGLVQSHVVEQREKSLGVNLSSPSISTHARRSSKSPPTDIKYVQQLRAEFTRDYLELLGYESIKDLSPSERADLVAAWGERKSALSV
ncbi:Uncharacterized protein Y057_14512 [Fusarium fujikuroi]|nr:Uncharacterized protein Y057_14512 [Fusarium fujikuroi]SCN98219.1 uncharacterized protein FFE2_08919 [Fusarium fujikuroi]SCO07076.1 uncharacterized protein FFC1_10307 [Fusarium fujikuroi]